MNEPPWDDALAEALLARPTPRTVGELLAKLPAEWRHNPAARRAAAEALWLHRHTAAAFGTSLPAGFSAKVAAAAGARPTPRRPALKPWFLLGGGLAAAVALAPFLRKAPERAPEIVRIDPPAPAVPAAPAELKLDFGDSLFALAAAPTTPAAPRWRVSLPAADTFQGAGAELGAQVKPVAASVGKAFAFLGDIPALAGRTM